MAIVLYRSDNQGYNEKHCLGGLWARTEAGWHYLVVGYIKQLIIAKFSELFSLLCKIWHTMGRYQMIRTIEDEKNAICAYLGGVHLQSKHWGGRISGSSRWPGSTSSSRTAKDTQILLSIYTENICWIQLQCCKYKSNSFKCAYICRLGFWKNTL